MIVKIQFLPFPKQVFKNCKSPSLDADIHANI